MGNGSAASQLDADIVVVGAGPVGTSTALKLASHGRSTIVLEARPTLGSEPRATTFHPPTLEMLAELGLTQPLLDEGIICHSYQFRDAKLGRIAELDYDVLAGDTSYPFRLQVEQSRLTEMALTALETHPNATIRSSTRVTDVTQEDGHVAVTAESAQGTETLRAGLVIGADGSRSAVRESLGIDFRGHTYPERYLVISTTLPLHELLPDIANVNYVSDPENWHVLLRNPAGWRVLFPAPFDENTDAQLLSEDNVLANLRRVVPDVTGYPVAHVTLYQVHRKVADRFRQGSIFLVGDAAHVNNPLGGMGMNSGIHDGMLLAGILANDTGNGSVADQLDGWADRRREVALEYVGKETDANWTALREQDETRRAQQRERWRTLGTDHDARREFLRVASMLSSVR